MKTMIILLALACAGCGEAATKINSDLERQIAMDKKVERLDNGLHGFVDAKTGCEYLSNGRSLTPRMGADGKQICGARP